VTRSGDEVALGIDARGGRLDPLLADRVATIGGRIDHDHDRVTVSVPVFEQ
jgi:hypothetical protein